MIPETLLGRLIGGATSLVVLLLFGVLTSVITKALMGPVFGTETEKPVVEPDVFFYDAATGAIGASTSIAATNVENLLSLGVIDVAEAAALKDRVTGAPPEPIESGGGPSHHGH